MQFQFTAMTLTFAQEILTWKYDGPYAFYNYEKSAAHLLDAEKWGKSLFAVLDETGQLVAELTVGFLNADDEWVSQADMDACQLAGCILWIGLGMRPDLTGRGFGLAFVNACVDFSGRLARERYQYLGDSIGLNVYLFNQRAIKVYERAGFVKFAERSRMIEGQEYKSQWMMRKVNEREI